MARFHLMASPNAYSATLATVRARLITIAVLLGAAVFPACASAHAERATYFPDYTLGAVPKYRTTGPAHVVCKADSARRIRKIFAPGSKRDRRLRQLKSCKFRDIQAAVNASKTGDRIMIMPGVYLEEPSRKIPVKDPKCEGPQYWEASGDNHTADGRVPTFAHQAVCPNSRSLIAIIGDSLSDPDRTCDHRCNLQLHGMGRNPKDVKIVGDRFKVDVIRADRADGFQLRNVWVEQAWYNDVNVVETNGFRLTHLVAPYAQHYGILSFASDNGLYSDIEAYGNGDSGVYPGSGPEGHCKRYGIEIRNVDSHDNVIGQSGTAGNGTWIHNSKFHDNAAGISSDSFAPGHPGMPQDCSKWENNEVYSNNFNPFSNENQKYCNSTPFDKRPKAHVCAQFLAVVGTGFMLYGVNDNLLRANRVYDNWRSGMRLFWVPSTLRGDNHPDEQTDTSNGNHTVSNSFGVGPGGKSMPNGNDVYWDEQGRGNCWNSNATAPGKKLKSDPALLPDCEGLDTSVLPVSRPDKTAADALCATWSPRDNSAPPGCAWFTTPPKPQG
jgi:hypothetical protein